MAVPATRRPKIVSVNKDREEELKKVSEKQRELESTTGSTPGNGGNSSRN